MHSPRRKSRRRHTRKEKGKKKVSNSGTDRNESNRHESDSEGTGDGSSKAKSASAEKASTSANDRLRRSTRPKNLVVRFRDEYMAHHYAYMTRVAEVREPESYAEATKDANWRVAMEEEMHALTENKDLGPGCRTEGCEADWL